MRVPVDVFELLELFVSVCVTFTDLVLKTVETGDLVKNPVTVEKSEGCDVLDERVERVEVLVGRIGKIRGIRCELPNANNNRKTKSILAFSY